MIRLLVPVVCFLVIGATLHTAGSAGAEPHSRVPTGSMIGPSGILALLGVANMRADDQAAPTSTTTATPRPGTPAPSPTTTVPPFPDPQIVLAGRDTAYARIRSARFEEVTTAVHPNIERAVVDGKGDATCTRISLKAHVTGRDALETIGSTTTINKYFTQISKQAYERSAATHGRWAKVKRSEVQTYVVNPLACASGTSSPGASNFVIKNLVNLGPDTYAGHLVWHVQAELVDTAGNTTATADYLVGQSDQLPYRSSVAFDEATGNVTGTVTLTLAKFGERLTIKAPRIGSK